jgi:hypothetical protein
MPQFCLSDGDHRLPLALAPLHCLQFQDNAKVGSNQGNAVLQPCSTSISLYLFSHLFFSVFLGRVLLIVPCPFASDRALEKGGHGIQCGHCGDLEEEHGEFLDAKERSKERA